MGETRRAADTRREEKPAVPGTSDRQPERNRTWIAPGSLINAMSTRPAPRDLLAPGWPGTALQWLRAAGNVVNLTTPLGLAVAAIGRARIRRGPRGLVVCERYRLRFPVASAFTIGNVVITAGSWEALLARNSTLLAHEERHTWQYLWCLGLPFYPLYGLCTLWSLVRTRDRAARNWFERHAGLADGGYRDAPIRPIGENLRALLRWRRPVSRS